MRQTPDARRGGQRPVFDPGAARTTSGLRVEAADPECIDIPLAPTVERLGTRPPWQWAAIPISLLTACLAAAIVSAPGPGAARSAPDAAAAATVSATREPHVATGGSAGPTQRSESRSLALVMPDEDAVFVDRVIAVAGYAYARPHSRVSRAVVIEATSRGRLVTTAEIAVHAGQFAATIELPDSIIEGAVQLRLRHPLVTSQTVVRHLTLLDALSGYRLGRATTALRGPGPVRAAANQVATSQSVDRRDHLVHSLASPAASGRRARARRWSVRTP